jgi:hypothetical protein
MLFQQVWMTALTFSSARGGTIQPYVPGANQFMIQPPAGDAEIFVEHDNQVPGSWYVRLVNQHTRKSGLGPIYIPPVTTQEGLEKALKRVWDIDQQHRQFLGRFFTRLREPAHDGETANESVLSYEEEEEGDPSNSPRQSA